MATNTQNTTSPVDDAEEPSTVEADSGRTNAVKKRKLNTSAELNAGTGEPTVSPLYLVLSLDRPMSPFAVDKGLRAIAGELASVTRLRSGDYLIQAKTAKQSETLLAATNLLDVPVVFAPHRSFNQSQAVITCRDINDCSNEEITENLSAQGVIAAKRLGHSSSYIITFGMPTIPHNVKVGWLNCVCRPYIPNPIRCFNCQRYGHGTRTCKQREPTCVNCGKKGHLKETCENEPKCFNCGDSHPASDRSCPAFSLERHVYRYKIEHKVSFPEARRIVQQPVALPALNTPLAPSFAQVVSVNNHLTSPATSTDKPKMCTIATQTMISWVAEEQTIYTREVEVQTTPTEEIMEIEIVEVDDVIISASGADGTPLPQSIRTASPKPQRASQKPPSQPSSANGLTPVAGTTAKSSDTPATDFTKPATDFTKPATDLSKPKSKNSNSNHTSSSPRFRNQRSSNQSPSPRSKRSFSASSATSRNIQRNRQHSPITFKASTATSHKILKDFRGIPVTLPKQQ